MKVEFRSILSNSVTLSHDHCIFARLSIAKCAITNPGSLGLLLLFSFLDTQKEKQCGDFKPRIGG